MMEPQRAFMTSDCRIRKGRRRGDVGGASGGSQNPSTKSSTFPFTFPNRLLGPFLIVTFILIGASTAFPTKTSSSRWTAVMPRMLPCSPFSDSYVRQHCCPSSSLVNIWRSDVPSPLGLDYSQEKNTSKLVLEAETLRAQAKAIMDQALAMEKDLKERHSKDRTSKLKELDELIQQWLGSGNIHNSSGCLANVTVVAHRLQEQKATAKQVLLVAERIFDLQMESSGQTAFLEEGTGSSTTGVKVTHPNDAIIQNVTLYEHRIDMMDTLSRAVALVDERVNNRTEKAATERWNGRVYPALQTQLNELRRTQQMKLDRKLAADINTATQFATRSAEEYLRRNRSGQVVGDDGTKIIVLEKKMELVPLWVPATFLPFIISSTSSTLGQDEVKQLLDDVLMGSRFYVTSHHSVPGAAIFRGNIRGFGIKAAGKTVPSEQPSAMAFADIQKRLQQIPGLRDRVQLFLLDDPEWRPKQGDDESEAKPVILALSTSISPDQSNIKQRLFVRIGKKLLYPLVAWTTFQYALQAFSLNKLFFYSVVQRRRVNFVIRTCLPICGGVFGIQLLQEVVHFLVAKWRRIKIGQPTPIPSFEIGTFGCVTPIKSFPPNRAALLDFALSGPFATTIASMGCIIASVLLTVRASPAALATFPVLPAIVMKSSFLAGTLTSWIASKIMMLPPAQPVPIHPLFLVGYAGLIASGLNLLPVFRLDGGRACYAAMGQRQAAVISVSVLLFLLSLALSGGSGLGFSWGMIIAIFQRQQEIPPRDDVTEVDNIRLASWIFSVLLAVSILAPFPGATSLL